jgi:hypothetical protein
MRHLEVRWANFSRYQSLDLVHRTCARPESHCDVHMSWDGDALWMDTQDLQFFWPGERVSIRPVRVEAMFDGLPGNLHCPTMMASWSPTNWRGRPDHPGAVARITGA